MSSRRKKQAASGSRAKTRSSARIQKRMLAEVTNLSPDREASEPEPEISKPDVDMVKPSSNSRPQQEVTAVVPTTASVAAAIPRSSPSLMETIRDGFNSGVAMITSLVSPSKNASSRTTETAKSDQDDLVASMKALSISPATTAVPQQSPPATTSITDALAAKLRRDSFGIRDLQGMDFESELQADDGQSAVSSDASMSEEPTKPTPNVSDRKAKKRLSSSGVLFSTSPISNASDDSFHSEPDHEGCPAPYVALNPAMLSDKEKWAHRDLQKVAVKLGVHAGGKREDIIDRLLKWHKEKQDQELNVPANNFALRPVDVDHFLHSDKKKKSNSNKKKSASKLPKPRSFKEHHLTPLVKKHNDSKKGDTKGILSPPIHERKSSTKKQLTFSVFNGVKIIPARDRSNSTPGRIQTDQQASGQENDSNNSNNTVSVPETHEEGDEGSVESPEEKESSQAAVSPPEDESSPMEEQGEEKQEEPQSLATKRLSFDDDEDEELGEKGDVEAEVEEKQEQKKPQSQPQAQRPASPANTPIVSISAITKPVASKPAQQPAVTIAPIVVAKPTPITVTGTKINTAAVAQNSSHPVPQSSLQELAAAYQQNKLERQQAATAIAATSGNLITSKPAIISSASKVDTSSKPSVSMSFQLNGAPMLPMPSPSANTNGGMMQQAFGGGSARAPQIAPAASGNKSKKTWGRV